MFDRYGDITKFITEPDKLIYDGVMFVSISDMNDYDIRFDLDSRFGSFDEQKTFIAFLAGHICEMDNTVQRFANSRCLQDGISEFTYSKYPQNIKIITEPKEAECDYRLDFISRTNSLKNRGANYVFITLDYCVPKSNSQFDAIFEYVDGRFHLRRFKNIIEIPDDWDEGV